MAETRSQIHFLDVLRGAAAWLVVWDHLFAIYPERLGTTLPVVDAVHRWVNEPLGLIQNFGWFGVCLFFLISGFVITHVSLRETAAEFALKRVLRIFPLLALAVLLSVALDDDARQQATPATVLTSMPLVNYWIHPQVVLVGVAWTLAIEVLFYAWVLLSFPLRRWPAARAVLLLGAVVATVLTARQFGHGYFLFAATAAYLPYLAVGQVLYFALHQRSIGPALAVSLLALAHLALVLGLRHIHVQFLPLDNSYLVSFLFALVVFLLAWAVNDRLRPGPVIRALADTSYSVYLFHGIVGFYLLDRWVPHLGLPAALALTVPVMFAFVLLVHHTVERPLLAQARRLAARLRSHAAAANAA